MADIDAVINDALKESDGSRRRRLLFALPAATPAASTFDTVVRALKDNDDLTRRTAAMEIMAALGDRAHQHVRALLDDDHVGVRRLAVDILGLAPNKAAQPLLEKATGDASTTVRAAALDGLARTGGHDAQRVLMRHLEADVPAAVALAALLGLESMGTTIAASTARRWLDDALTAATALRALGRAGDIASVVPSLLSPSRLRVRASLLGLHDGTERGAPLTPAMLDESMRHKLNSVINDGDLATASAAAIVLSRVGDVRGIEAALGRADANALLPALHKAVALCREAGVDIDSALQKLDDATAKDTPASLALRELCAAQRRAPSARLRKEPLALDDDAFARLSRWFSIRAGLALGNDARARVEARLIPRLEAKGARSFDAYLSLIDDDDDEAAIATDAITIHETYFFREPLSLDGLRHDAIPLLSADRRLASASLTNSSPVTVWSAGCSSGEEAFTIASILEKQRRAPHTSLHDYRVIGTDVSPVSIEHAQRALYGPRSFRWPLSPDEDLAFDPPQPSGLRRPRAELRERVQFRVMNLCDAGAIATLPTFDVVFCRNVLIYLTPEARRSVLQSLHDSLRPGGMLFLGHSESLLHVESPFELWPLSRGLAYRRPQS